MGKKVSWTEEEVNSLTAMFFEDKSDVEIAEELGLALNQVRSKIRRLNLPKLHKRPTRVKNLIGQRFGRLTVIERADNLIIDSSHQRARWVCKCDCGNVVIVTSDLLTSGHTMSCGCLAKDLTRERNIARRTQNEYIIDRENNIAVGITSSGVKFAVDLDDFEKIKPYKWHNTEDGYIQAHDFDKKRTTLRLNRVVIGVQGEDWINNHVDHINRIPEDNRKCNLRIATNSENLRNIYRKYVSYHKASKKWYARITCDGERKVLGLYDTEKEALEAIKEYKRSLNDEFMYEESMRIAEQNGYIDFDKYEFNKQ